MTTWIVGGALALIVAAIIWGLIRGRRRGGGCCGDCAHCAGCGKRPVHTNSR